MFTGIIEEVGAITMVAERPGLTALGVACRKVLEGAAVGSSLAVNGVCLTAVEVGPGFAGFEVVPETLRRTNLGLLAAGDRVNLERPMAAHSRFGGHIVQGHIDGLATIMSVSPEGESLLFEFETTAEIARYLVEKGFVAVDGVSLTITRAEANRFGVALIPHTIKSVVIGSKGVGYRANVEVDILAKYVAKLAGAYGGRA